MVFKLLFLGLFLVSCSQGKLSNDILFVLLDSKPRTLDPRKATDANGMRILDLIFSGFVKVQGKGNLQPDAAFKWHIDQKVYTFYLRPNLRFVNGRPVTKADILFSFEEFMKPGSIFLLCF